MACCGMTPGNRPHLAPVEAWPNGRAGDPARVYREIKSSAYVPLMLDWCKEYEQEMRAKAKTFNSQAYVLSRLQPPSSSKGDSSFDVGP